MARTVGYPVAIATRLVMLGKIGGGSSGLTVS